MTRPQNFVFKNLIHMQKEVLCKSYKQTSYNQKHCAQSLQSQQRANNTHSIEWMQCIIELFVTQEFVVCVQESNHAPKPSAHTLCNGKNTYKTHQNS